MKPLKLIIDGIRSFSNRVEIDFESVSKSGLFGIFGATGSGKSTILDSVIVALYGDLSGIKTAELISARRKSAFISLEFEICDNQVRRKYIVERTFKLKKDGQYGGAIASLYEVKCGSTYSIASLTNEVNKKIEEIIGLGQNEFTKCIILPQGEFAEFVKAPKAERVKIIEKLFGLERYGEKFNAKLKAKKEEVELELFALNRDLSTLENVTAEVLNNARLEMENTLKMRNEENVKLLKIAEYIEQNTHLYNLYVKCLQDKEELAKLKEKQSEIEKMKTLVDSYDKAKEVVALGEELDRVLEREKQIDKDIQKLESTFETLQNEKKIIESQYGELDNLKAEKDRLKARSEELISIGADIVNFKSLRKEVLTLANELKEKAQRISDLKVEIVVFSDKCTELISNIEYLEDKTDVSKAFSFVSNEVLKTEFANQIEYYSRQSKKLTDFESQDELYIYVKNTVDNRLFEYKKHYDDLTVVDSVDVQSVVENFKDLLGKRNDAVKNLGVVNGKIDSYKIELKSLEKQVEFCKKDYDEKKIELDNLSEKLLKIIDNIEDYENQLTFCSHCIKDVEKKENSIKEKKEEIENKCKQYEKERFEKNVIKDSLIAEKQKAESALVSKLSHSVISLEQAKNLLSQSGDVQSLVEQIEKYEKAIVYYTMAVEKAEQTLKDVEFDAETYVKNCQIKRDLETKVSILQENFGKYQNNVKNLSHIFDKRCIIEKDMQSVGARASVLARLEQVVSRRAFSEFISAEFLSDVALQARKTLLELTSGKYDVVYKDSVESGKDGFYIRDNLNGGIERSVASLSGGETFLVSLSLALALSVGIYSRSEKPMEFFFLDEGFGTLDESLVDTVLDSLEKLRNKNFSIGLISHLSEMKSRIDSKIIVTPATENSGSKVTQKTN